MSRSISASGPMSLRIEWQHDGRRIVLPALVLRPTPSLDLSGHDGTALLDTGATNSGIAPRVVRELGLTPIGKRPLGSARSEEQAERYLFRIGLVSSRRPGDPPGYPYVFDDIIGFELGEHFQFDLLLGMDVLSQCAFEMNRRGRCLLTAA